MIAYNTDFTLNLYVHAGIQIQSDRIPLRFFVRLLHDGCRIVFTGNHCVSHV